MKTLYAGPWVGEFGWELCWWNPVVRHYAEEYDRVIVASHESSRYLYEFADEFIPLRTDGGFNMWQGTLRGESPEVKSDRHLFPKVLYADWNNKPRKWQSLAQSSLGKAANILCAFRPPKKWGNGTIRAGKDYPKKKCRQIIDMLTDRGFTVGCYGTKMNYWFEGTDDLRGVPLKELCGHLAGAKCVIGPSSGTIHLASLCGCPHVTWFSLRHATLRRRYEKDWNPFSTPVAFLPGQPPSPEIVATAAESLVSARPTD